MFFLSESWLRKMTPLIPNQFIFFAAGFIKFIAAAVK
jgi:hypothetical protein